MRSLIKTTVSLTAVAIFLFFASKSYAQIPTVQDCLGAIPICQPIFSEANAYQGTGNYLNEINSGPSCLGSGEKNDVWYIFTVSQAGNLSFSITPNNMNDDYDWAVYNVTNNVCGDIFNNLAMEVSCNYSGTPGITGPNGLGGSQNEATVAVQYGDIYVVNVSQYSSSLNGYTIDFIASSADIYDNVTPHILHAASTEYCDSSVVSIHFNENILCNSVDPLDFRVYGPGNPIVTGVTSPTCDITGTQGYGIDFELHLDKPLQLGNYGIVVYPHTSNSVIDNCGNQCNGGLPEQIFFNTIPEGGMSMTLEPTQITCNGLTDGIITTSVLNHQSIAAGGDLIYKLDANPQDFTGVYSGLSAGTYTVEVTTVGGCIGHATVDIIEPPQAFANAGRDTVLCGLPEYELTGNVPLVGVGTWTTTSAATNFTNISDATTMITNIPYGTYTYTWTVDNGVCGTFTDNLQLTRYPSNNFVGNDQELCDPLSLSLNAPNPFPGTGQWISSDPAVVFDNTTNFSASISNLAFGQTTLIWTMNLAECGILSDELIVSNYQNPVFTSAGADDNFCEKNGQLNADNPPIGTGTWSTTGGGIILTPSATNSFVQNIDPGYNDFTWTITNGACPAISDIVRLQRLSASDAVLGSDYSICGADTTLAGNIPQNGTGIWIGQSAALVSNSTLYNTSVTNLAAGDNEFIWKIQNQTCPASTDTIIITRFLEPSFADAGNNGRICNSNITLSGNQPEIGTGLWTTSGTASILFPTLSTTDISGLTYGVNIFTWTISNGTCLPKEDIVLILRDEEVGFANAGSDVTLCQDNYILNAINPTVGSGHWTTTSGASISNINDPNATISNIPFGQNTFVWKIQNGACNTQASVNVFRNPDLPAANAGINQELCSSTSSLTGNLPQNGTGFWTTNSSAIIDNSAQSTIQVSNLVEGDNIFTWNISDGVCLPKIDDVIITIDKMPSVSDPGNDFIVCDNYASLNAILPVIGTGTWVSQGAAFAANPSIQNSIVLNLQPGDNIMTWQVTNGTCPPSENSVTITRDVALTVANAGADLAFCQNEPASLSGNDPLSGLGNWTTTGTQVIDNNTLYNTALSNLNIGANFFTWTVQYGVCPPTTDNVVITIEESPTIANAGPDKVLCASNTSLSANLPTVGTGSWTSTSTALIVNPAGNNTFVGNLEVGQNIFTWTISGTVCPASTDDVIITQDSPAFVYAGSDTILCADNLILNANEPFSGIGLWTSSTGVVFANSSVYNTSATNFAYGNNILTWQVSGGVCPPAQNQVTITKEVAPSVANAGVDFSVCANDATLSGNNPSVGTGIWLSLNTSTALNNTSFNTTVTNLEIGENHFIWQISNASCPPSQDEIIIIRDEQPVANAGTNMSLCADTADLLAQIPAVGVGNWSTTGSSLFLNATAFNAQVTNLQVGNNVFYWNVTNGVCPPAQGQVTVYREANPSTANAGVDFSVCANDATLSGNNPSVGTGIWLSLNTSTALNNTSFNTTVTNLEIGENHFIWQISNASCPPSQDEIIIIRDEQPVANAGENTSVCADSTSINAEIPIIGTGFWTTNSSATLSNSTIFEPYVVNMQAGNNIFYWNVVNGVCAVAIDSIIIDAFHDIFAPVPQIEDLPDLTAACSFTITEIPVATDNCKGQITATTTDSVSYTTQGTHIVIWTFDDGNGNISTQPQKIIISDITNPQIICPQSVEVYADTTLGHRVYTVQGNEFDPVSYNDNCLVSAIANDYSFANTLADAEIPEGITQVTWTVTDANSNSNECTVDIKVLVKLDQNTDCDNDGIPDWADPDNCFVTIPEGFSPNNDGINDLLIISGLGTSPDNKLTIFNRWGEKVYQASPYTNNWDGKATAGFSLKKGDLPEGTYFYIFQIDKSGTVIKGFIQLER